MAAREGAADAGQALMQCTTPPQRPRRGSVVTLESLEDFDEVIDARSPAEYAEDHIPGAVNLPVLNDAERAQVGTLYKQVSPFTAKKVGAALVSRNIAHHLETHFAERSKDYRPLVYCWRGGNRSGAMVTVLRAIGWEAAQLEGGYKAYRRYVVAALEQLPQLLRFVVVCGKTGVGKSRFLRALTDLGGAGAGPGGPRGTYGARSSGLSPATTTAAETLRDARVAGAAAFRPAASGLRRIREQEDRQPAHPRDPATAHAGL